MAVEVDKIVFNDHINYGFEVHEQFFVDVLTSKTRVESRIGLAQASIKTWTCDDDATKEIAAEMQAFLLGRRGRLHGFLWKDWLDYKVVDFNIGNDGIETEYQIYRVYDDAIRPYSRKVMFPKLDTVVVEKDGSPFSSSDYVVDDETGILTLDVAQAGVFTVSCEFYHPVRLQDEGWRMTLEDFDMVNIRGLVLTELVDDEA